MSPHAEVAELLGAYALDAVDPDEAVRVEAHLADCPRCRAELREHREVTALVAWGGQDAPAEVWDRIVATMAETAPPPLDLDRIAPLRAASPGGTGDRRAARAARSRWRRPVNAVAVAAAVVVALLVTQIVHLEHRVNQVQAAVGQVDPNQPTMVAVRSALADPGSRRVVLTPVGSSQPMLDAVILPSGRGFIYDTHLTPLPADRVYQLWGVAGGQRISYGLLGTDPGIVAFTAGPGVKALAVTDEVADGTVTSTAPYVAAGAFGPAA